jgi:uncharacterized protein YdiU (UPF0061 family)
MRRISAAKALGLQKSQPAPLKRENARPAHEIYSAFNQLDGSHPWQQLIPEGFVGYPVKKLKRSKILYFNFALAKEMGLIPESHPLRLNGKLEQKVLDTFAIQIINEYDQHILKKKFSKQEKTHMATRYLQLQHPDKSGRTSGDGRSIWNGLIRHRGVSWDVSSRGTGVTKLAPGTVRAGCFLKTGGEKYGYGCGTADIDELFGSLMMSEIFHRQGISTERVLAIIETGKGRGIGVRASPCLFRPAHLLGFLKQNRYDSLKRAFDFVIDRQIENGDWDISLTDPARFSKVTRFIATDFAKSVARWELDHIFVWLAWDGDNVLINGGIIDYGSVRQFGLRHDKYRYDDSDRLSTSLSEQKAQARLIIQSFLQASDFLETGRKKPLMRFAKHSTIKFFDSEFEKFKLQHFLYRIGFTKRQWLFLEKTKLVQEFYSDFIYFEKVKTKRKPAKLPDGYNKPAIFNMRKFLFLLPKALLKRRLKPLSTLNLFSAMKSETASVRDLKWLKKYEAKLLRLQRNYLEMITQLPGDKFQNLQTVARRSSIINQPDRITGNSIDIGVKELLSWKQKGMRPNQIQSIIEAFIEGQVLVPQEDRQATGGEVLKLPVYNRYLNSLMTIVFEYMEDI